jgi:Na+/proline symporter
LLQIVNARFGKSAHIVFCVVALTANLMTTTVLILAGKSAIQALTVDASDEFVMLVLVVLFGSYCFIGGLGTTFYISYFNASLILVSLAVFIVKTQYIQEPGIAKFASTDAMYDAMSCLTGPDGNEGNSMLTFRSRTGIIYGISLFFMSTSLGFCDQANWQSRIAAKPAQGVVGFLIAAYIWFAIPTALGLTGAMTYMSLSYQNGTHLLSAGDIDDGKSESACSFKLILLVHTNNYMFNVGHNLSML